MFFGRGRGILKEIGVPERNKEQSAGQFTSYGRGRGFSKEKEVAGTALPNCAICKTVIELEEDASCLQEKGCATINNASKIRNDIIACTPGDSVHKKCRLNYCNKYQLSKVNNEQSSSETSIKTLRSSNDVFNFQKQCFLCSMNVCVKERARIVKVRTVELKHKLTDICKQRSDSWADSVQKRILSVHDLHAADALYHHTCMVNFSSNRRMPTNRQEQSEEIKKGRPQYEERNEAFLEVTQYLLDNDDEQTTINDLIDHMNAILADSQYTAYSFRHMKERLVEIFGDKIIITEIHGKSNVVTFRSTANNLLQEFYNRKKVDTTSEKTNVIKTAAKLIKEDIKSVDTSHEYYPNYEELMSEEYNLHFLPESLRLLLEELFVGKDMHSKIASIGQVLMQATRPKVLLPPLQIGLGIQLHHCFGSRFLIDSLHKHGFCCSYKEVQKFENNAAFHQANEIPNYSSEFIQYAADNVDHNLRTLDGYGTFHGMGMIAAVTPAKKFSKQIPRAQMALTDLAHVGRLNISYHKETSDLSMLSYNKLFSIQASDQISNLDLLSLTSNVFEQTTPSWGGMMQHIYKGTHPGKSSILFLPMIDMNPSDSTCIYSTLQFLCQHAERYQVTPIITFDQPLWQKALAIIESEPDNSPVKNVVLRLGGFHTEMSFVGCIGHIMSGSGLKELLETIYSSNAVQHILSGKAISRAVRAHLIIESALHSILLCDAYNLPLPQTVSDNSSGVNLCTDISEAELLYNDLDKQLLDLEAIEDADVLNRIKLKMNEHIAQILESRNVKLWLQYMEMVNILRRFIRAERTGDWNLHLQTLHEMLPFLAASGHNNYTKCIYLYIQKMENLMYTHPLVYEQFLAGFHVIRRSDRKWAGLSSDLVIEQVLMRSVKSTGGLTRGRGMTEQQRLKWLLSMPACAEMNSSMQEFTKVNYNSGEQNKDMSEARKSQDRKDMNTALDFCQERQLFSTEGKLRNIATGLHAQESVNADSAKLVGHQILKNMHGKVVSSYTFRRKEQVTTLNSRCSVRIGEETCVIDPQLLFQRLTYTASQVNPNQLDDLFKYELCSYPPSLFDSNEFL